MRPKLRLKDLRRLMHRTVVVHRKEGEYVALKPYWLPDEILIQGGLFWPKSQFLSPRDLDRLISLLGPNFTGIELLNPVNVASQEVGPDYSEESNHGESGEEEFDGSPQGGATDDCETDSLENFVLNELRLAEHRDFPKCAGGEETSEVTPSGSTAEASCPEQGEGSAYSKPTGQSDSLDVGEGVSSPSEIPGCNQPGGAWDGDDSSHGKKHKKYTEEGGSVTSSIALNLKEEACGFNASKEDALKHISPSEEDARNVVESLEKLVQSINIGGEEESRRIDSRKFCKEIVAKRYNLQRACRRELQHPKLLLLCDVSESCSSVCPSTLIACMAIEKCYKDAMVIRHSNGFLEDGTHVPDYLKKTGYKVEVVLAFGDWDAGDCYRKLLEECLYFIWLDYGYSSAVGVAGSYLQGRAAEWKRKPDLWYEGVHDAATASLALQMAARRIRDERERQKRFSRKSL